MSDNDKLLKCFNYLKAADVQVSKIEILDSIRAGCAATFDPHNNVIGIGSPSLCKTAGFWAKNILHELGHWTGRDLGRKLGTPPEDRFNSIPYCVEEIIAESCAISLVRDLNFKEIIDLELDSDNYRKMFSKNLNSEVIAWAISKGDEAANYIRMI